MIAACPRCRAARARPPECRRAIRIAELHRRPRHRQRVLRAPRDRLALSLHHQRQDADGQVIRHVDREELHATVAQGEQESRVRDRRPSLAMTGVAAVALARCSAACQAAAHRDCARCRRSRPLRVANPVSGKGEQSSFGAQTNARYALQVGRGRDAFQPRSSGEIPPTPRRRKTDKDCHRRHHAKALRNRQTAGQGRWSLGSKTPLRRADARGCRDVVGTGWVTPSQEAMLQPRLCGGMVRPSFASDWQGNH